MKVCISCAKKLIMIIACVVLFFVLCMLICACGDTDDRNNDRGNAFSDVEIDNYIDSDYFSSNKPDSENDGSNENNQSTSESDTLTQKPVSTGSSSSNKTSKPTGSPQKPSATPKTSGSQTVVKPTPTPTANSGSVIADGTVVFDVPSGFYQNSGKRISLKAAKGHDIYYTMDCSDPRNSSSAKKYSTSISITDKSSTNGNDDKVSVIRAIAVKSGESISSATTVYTNTYILNRNHQNFASRYGKLGVFSVNLDNDVMFGTDGIYTNYTQHGRETERQASIEFFEAGGTREIAMDAGLRIYGGTSRALAQKSLKIVARKEYSTNGKFKYAFFDDNYDKDGKLIKKYDSIVLRAGGNDSLLAGDRATALRDAVAHKLAVGIDNISCQNARPVVVYLNGNYWGIYFLREDLDNDYLESHYGVLKDNVAILSYGHENGSWFYKLDEGTETDKNSYINMISYIRNNDMSNNQNYNQAGKMLDMDNFAKFMAINIYLNNRDWPQNNVRMWKYIGASDSANTYTDGKWRYMLKDIDYATGRYVGGGGAEDVTSSATRHNENVIMGIAGDDISAAFASLLTNSTFCTKFISEMNKVSGDYYSYSNALAQINEYKNAIKSEMNYHVQCTWGGLGGVPLSVSQWENNVSNTLVVYFRARKSTVDSLIEYLF